MHNIHFIKVNAGSCQEAFERIHLWVDVENTDVDWFQIIGTYNLNNLHDYLEDENSNRWQLTSILGNEPNNFINKSLQLLNHNYRPLQEVKQEIIDLLNKLDEQTAQELLAWEIHSKTKVLTASYLITDIITQSKYDMDWSEVGLTGLDDEPTHLVLVDFHS
ncbi:MAG: hypothetical protein K2Y14_01035 [Burkholderiales bacterium]|nr:hypothetical protein [Burkholderiales bacterium]